MFKYTAICANHLRKLQTPFLCNTIDLLSQQTRNTHILKRRHPVRLYKKNDKRPPFLKKRSFIYDWVEPTNSRKHPQIDVILVQNVDDVGRKGEQFTMSSERAYYKFLLPKLAVYATPENIEKYVNQRAEGEETRFIPVNVQRTLKWLSSYCLLVEMSMDEPWTLEKWHMRTAFRKNNIHMGEDCITMPEKSISGPNLDFQMKEFYVTVTINNSEDVKVRCKIHHWTSDPKREIHSDVPFWEEPSIAIHPEDQPILDSMPISSLLKKKK